MHEDPFRGLTGSRKQQGGSVRRIKSAHGPRVIEQPQGNEYMFLEDLRLRALPYGRGLDDGFNIEIQPFSARVQELVRDALPVRTYRHWELREAFRDFIHSSLWHLAQGDLYLQIKYFWNPDNQTGRPVAFGIDLLDPESVVWSFGKYRHLIPRETEPAESKRWSAEPLDSARLVVVSLPRRLRRELKHTLRVIRAADQDLRVMSTFITGEHGTNSGFDFGAYQRLSHDIVLRASRATGWSGRGLHAEGLLDPEKAWRAMQFARLVVTLRDAALQGLQEVVDRAGVEIGFAGNLIVSKVLTSADLDCMERDMDAGTRPIEEMFFPKPS